jgi:hypothetical protein
MTTITGQVGIGPGWPPTRTKRPVFVSARYPSRATVGELVVEPVWAEVRVSGAGRFVIEDVEPGFVQLRIQHGNYLVTRTLQVPDSESVDYADLVEVDPATLEPLPDLPSTQDLIDELNAAIAAGLQGEPGEPGPPGEPGEQGPPGEPGADGSDADVVAYARALGIDGLGATIPRYSAASFPNISAGFAIIMRVRPIVSGLCVGVGFMPAGNSAPSLFKAALFDIDETGTGSLPTRLAVTGHMGSTVANTYQTGDFTAPLEVDHTRDYGLVLLAVGATPQLRGVAGNVNLNALQPFVGRFGPAAGGLTDMPAAIAAGDMTGGAASTPWVHLR